MATVLRHDNSSVTLNVKNREEFTPLHCACWHRQTEVAIALVDAGVDIDVTVSNLSTPLHFSAWHGDARLLQHLLAAGAKVGARTRDGDTALHQAVFGNRTQVGLAAFLYAVPFPVRTLCGPCCTMTAL